MAFSKVILNGETIMDVTGDTVDAGNLLSGNTATKNSGAKVTGNIATKSSSDLTASGATVTAPAGYYASAATKSVTSGTAGTPTATKGTVSNHSVSVTPSVTNTTGYITGSTKTGTAVTVSASELVSGTYNVTSSGTKDVTNYASASVPSADPYTAFYNNHFYTENNQRKWSITSLCEVDAGEGDTPGWLPDGFRETSDYVVNAVPQNTTVTPTTSAQTIGGSNYMMEGAVTVSAMPTGTAGTPTATKGAVSNHSVSVTPSVTNTTGYITGSTKTGTAVSVSASELVSGTKSITENGTGIDVTNYASVDVEVSSASTTHTATIVRSGVRDTNWPMYNYVKYNNTYYYTKGNTFTFNSGDTMDVRQLASSTGVPKIVMENGIVIATSSNNDYTYTYTMPDYDIEITLEQTWGATSSVNISKVNDFCKLIASTTYYVNTSSSTETSVGTFQTGDTSLWTSDKMVFIKIRAKSGRRNGYYYGSDAIVCNNAPGNGLTATSSYLIYGTSYYQNSAGNLLNYNLQRATNTSTITGYGIYPTRIYNDGSIDIYVRYSSSPAMGTIQDTFYVDVFLLDWFGGVSPFNG